MKGTRKTISLTDITALEGNRDPAFPSTQKDFNVAFINLTNEEESSLDTLEQTQKLYRFRDSFLRFFQDMARNLGSLLFPKGGSVGATAVGTSESSGAAVASQSPLYSHPFDDHYRFEPLDLKNLRPVDFSERLAKSEKK